jgi:hypothetical protein
MRMKKIVIDIEGMSENNVEMLKNHLCKRGLRYKEIDDSVGW